MSKNLRSFITILSLVFMLLAGVFTPYTAQARGKNSEQAQKSIIQRQQSIMWNASTESVDQFQELAENMGAEVQIVNARQAKQVEPSHSVSLSDKQVSAEELANWMKVQMHMANGNDDGGTPVEKFKIRISFGRDGISITFEWS